MEIPHFAAQAITACSPELKGRPLAVVAQNPGNRHSLVYACTPEARSRGVDRGMAMYEASGLCPDLEVVCRIREAESKTLKMLERILESYTPEYIRTSRGRVLLDLTGTPVLRSFAPAQAAVAIRQNIAGACGLQEMCMGLSRSALLARMLAASAEAGWLLWCSPREEIQALAQMEASLLPSLSASCREKLAAYGLMRVGQIRKLSKQALKGRFGSEGEALYLLSRGVDPGAARSRSQDLNVETVLEYDINEREVLRQKVRLTADRLCFRLKKGGLGTDRFLFSLKYTDNRMVRRTVYLPYSTNDFLTLAGRAEQAFRDLYTRRAALKAISLRASRPRREIRQLSLFDSSWRLKQKSIGDCLTRIRSKNRFSSILSGSNIPLKNGKGIRVDGKR